MVSKADSSQSLDMVKKIDFSVEQHLRKNEDLLLRVAQYGIVKTYRDSTGKLVVVKK